MTQPCNEHFDAGNLFSFVTDVDECASNPCDNNGICTDITDGYICNCTAGWTGPRCGQGREKGA